MTCGAEKSHSANKKRIHRVRYRYGQENIWRAEATVEKFKSSLQFPGGFSCRGNSARNPGTEYNYLAVCREYSLESLVCSWRTRARQPYELQTDEIRELIRVERKLDGLVFYQRESGALSATTLSYARC